MKKEITEKQENLRFRAVKLVCQKINSKTKEFLIDEKRIELAISSFRDNLTRYAWIYHDKDIYTTEEEVLENPNLKGKPKPPHYHIILEFKNQVYYKTLVKRFGVFEKYAPIYSHKKSSEFGFLKAVEYITHERQEEQLIGKHFYSDDLVHRNFDFRGEIIDMNNVLTKYDDATDDKDTLINRLINGKITLKDIERDFNQTFTKYADLFDKANDRRISNIPTPLHRINFYFGGKGGRLGKTIGAIAWATYLLTNYYDIDCKAKDFDINDYIYVCDGKGVAFDNYKGQMIIIYDEFRPKNLIEEFGNFATFLRAFDIMGGELKKVNVSKKFSKVKLVSKINIITCPFDFSEFVYQFKELTKIKKYNDFTKDEFIKTEDAKQIYGRFQGQNIFDTEKMVVSLNNDVLEFEYINAGKPKTYNNFLPIAKVPNIFFDIRQKTRSVNSNFIIASNKVISNALNDNTKSLFNSETLLTNIKDENVFDEKLDKELDELIDVKNKELKEKLEKEQFTDDDGNPLPF